VYTEADYNTNGYLPGTYITQIMVQQIEADFTVLWHINYN
jgi:hypothetical protein